MNKDPRRNKEGYIDLTAYTAISRLDREERQKQYRPLVYICSPFAGDVEQNIRNARRYCAFAARQVTIPLAPHLLFPQFMDDGNPDERKLCLRFGLVLLDRCEALWVFGAGVSEGMAAEIQRAGRRGIPVRYFNSACGEAVI